MAELYRVFPFLPGVRADQPGGALFIPPLGGGRLDNPDLYSVFYASNAEAGAIAEAFGRFPEWTRAILEGSPALPGSSRAVARYTLGEPARICNLDDAAELASLGLRPSDVVSRDYARTRAWSQRIFETGQWAGVRWWSYYDPRWASVGLWDRSALSLVHTRILRLDDAALREAGLAIARRVMDK